MTEERESKREAHDEEAHSRIDELTRKLEAIPAINHPRPAPGPRNNRLGDVDEEAHWRIDELERTLAAIPERIKLEELLTANAELLGAIRELVEVLRAPTVRTGTMNLPSGMVSVTTREQRL